jgi:hypothetical protein
LAIAKGIRVSNQQQAIEFCEENGYPVVVKPDVGVGAVSTYKICERSDFDTLEVKDGYFIEQFIEGKIVTFDGFADANSNIIFCQSHEYSHGVMEIVLNNSHVYYYSYREIPDDLLDAGQRTVKAFRVRERFFHIEFFRTNDNSIVCLEINIRPPGGFTMDMFNYACNVDMFKVYAEFVTGQRTEFKFSREFHVCYISRKTHIRYRYSHAEIMASSFAPDIVFTSSLPLGLQMMGDFCYIYRHRDLEVVRKFTCFVWEKPDLLEPHVNVSPWALSPAPRRDRSNSGSEKASLDPLSPGRSNSGSEKVSLDSSEHLLSPVPRDRSNSGDDGEKVPAVVVVDSVVDPAVVKSFEALEINEKKKQ